LPNLEIRQQAQLLLRKAEQDEAALAKLRDDFELGDEVLGFHAQQAVEKRLKAVLVFNEVEFERVHNISYLATLAEQNSVSLPACREEMEELTPWASLARYEDLLDGKLDRVTIEGTAIATREWAEDLVGSMSWLAGVATVVKHFAKHGELDHLILLVEGDDEGGVVHLTHDHSVWTGAIDQLTAYTLIGTLDRESGEHPSLDLNPFMRLDDGLAIIARNALHSVDGRQTLVVARSNSDRSFLWSHATADGVTKGESPPDSLSRLLLVADALADHAVGLGGFEKPGPDVRFSSDAAIRLSDLAVELLEEMNDEFREQFGRDLEPGDPIFWDRSADEPRQVPREEIADGIALAEELGATDLGKRLAGAQILMWTDELETSEDLDDDQEMGEINLLPLILVLSQASSIEGNLEDRCLYAAVHCWAEGHLAAAGHPEPLESEAELSSPPFPDPEVDGKRLHAITLDATARFGSEGHEVDAISYSAALGWKAGIDAGIRCDGCEIGEASGALARAMRSGEMRIRFHPKTLSHSSE
jgi:HEPN domain-containing protein